MRVANITFKCALLTLLGLLTCYEVYADEAFRSHRYDGFRVLDAPDSSMTVFIGNSITNMMNWDEAFDDVSIVNRGVSGAFTQEVLLNLGSMISGKPAKVFLMIGTNDLATPGVDNEPDQVAWRIKKILETIRQFSPQTEVYYQSILPSSRDNRPRERTEQTNRLVREWIESRGDSLLSYIDLYSLFVDQDGNLRDNYPSRHKKAVSFDGLHLTQRGYKIWMDTIAHLVGKRPVFPQDGDNAWGALGASNGMRVTHFNHFPLTSTDVLLVGDEMLNGAEWKELMRSADFKDRAIGWGAPGLSTDKFILAIDDMFPVKEGFNTDPRAIVLYSGLGDAHAAKEPEQFTCDYNALIEKLRNRFGNTPIFVMTIVPDRQEDKALKERIEVFNDSIRKLSADNENVHLIDLNKSMLRQNGKRDEGIFSSKKHALLSGTGYVHVASEMARVLNQYLGTEYKPLTFEEAKENRRHFFNATNELMSREVVFDNDASEVPYRIPAIAIAKNGDVLAVADYRHSKADIGMVKDGHVDLVYRIKNASTGQWSDKTLLASTIVNGDSITAFGDPCIVSDTVTGEIIVTSCSGNVSFPKGTPDNHQGVATFRSTDNGATWNREEDRSHQVFKHLSPRESSPLRAFFFASGKIAKSNKIRLTQYPRLYTAALINAGAEKIRANYVFYSDDFGRTWELLGDVTDVPVPEKGDEAKVEELPDGSVLISSRVGAGRWFNRFCYNDSTYRDGKWDNVAFSTHTEGGVKASANGCNGEIICLPVERVSDGAPVHLLLQSVPMDETGQRAHVGINYKLLEHNGHYSTSTDLASDWTGRYEITPVNSAYSTMIADENGDLLLFFEENEYNGGFDMIYQPLSVEQLTSGLYRARR